MLHILGLSLPKFRIMLDIWTPPAIILSKVIINALIFCIRSKHGYKKLINVCVCARAFVRVCIFNGQFLLENPLIKLLISKVLNIQI